MSFSFWGVKRQAFDELEIGRFQPLQRLDYPL